MDAGVKTASPGLLRILIVAGFVLASGIQAVRTAAVSASSTASDLGARIWPTHPRIMGQGLLLDVGQAAASGRTLSQLTREELARHSEALDDEFYEVLSARSWLESKVSEGGTALDRVREQLAHARASLR